MTGEPNLSRVAMQGRIAGTCGITSQLVAFISLLIVVSSSPWFSWTEDYVSFLGIQGSARMLFNWGIILAGLFSLIFAVGLRKRILLSRLGQLGVVSLIFGSIAFSAMGMFPISVDLPHDLASIAFFVFIILALLLVGVAAITASRVGWGLLSLIAGALILVFWLVPWTWSGGAIPQLLFCLPWSLWTVVFGVVLLMRASPIDV